MTIHKFSNSYYIKKRTFTYSDSNPGDSRNQKMWRCCSQIASDYMKFYINPLRLVFVPPPPPLPLIPAPPHLSQARSLIATLVTLTRGIQGCPKTISLDKSTWHLIFEKIFPVFFFFAAWHPRIFATPFAEKCTPSFISHQSENPFPVLFLRCSFSPFLNKCQLLMPRDFLEPPC